MLKSPKLTQCYPFASVCMCWQVVEEQLRAGTLLAINNASFYFQMKPTESHGLSPAGILVC